MSPSPPLKPSQSAGSISYPPTLDAVPETSLNDESADADAFELANSENENSDPSDRASANCRAGNDLLMRFALYFRNSANELPNI